MRPVVVLAGLSIAACAGVVMFTGVPSHSAQSVHDQICTRGYSQHFRLEGDAYKRFRDAAFAQAGQPTWKQCHRDDPRDYCLVVDHIQPLEIWSSNEGDPNAMSNVQLQTKVDAAAKDVLENAARADYCYNGAALSDVQARFRRTSP